MNSKHPPFGKLLLQREIKGYSLANNTKKVSLKRHVRSNLLICTGVVQFSDGQGVVLKGNPKGKAGQKSKPAHGVGNTLEKGASQRKQSVPHVQRI